MWQFRVRVWVWVWVVGMRVKREYKQGKENKMLKSLGHKCKKLEH
jgi:hypothetical protein